MPSPSRRSVLALGALVGALAATGCTGGGTGPHRAPRADPDLPLRRRAVAATDALLAAYDAVLAGSGADRADLLRERRADVAVHRAALARGLPPLAPSTAPSGTVPGASRSAPAVPTTAPTSPAGPTGPTGPAAGTPVRSVADLAAAERATAGARLADLEAASPELARLLAAVSAGDALNAAALGDHGPVDAPTTSPSPSVAAPSPSTSAAPTATAAVAALQSALSAEHAAVYGYGVVGARLPAGLEREDARACYTAHEALRDALERAVAAAGATPAAAAPGYRLPFAVDDADGARRLAAHVEGRLTTVYADAVAATTGPSRRTWASGLRGTALRAARWGAVLPALPGLPGSGAPSDRPSAASSPDAPPRT